MRRAQTSGSINLYLSARREPFLPLAVETADCRECCSSASEVVSLACEKRDERRLTEAGNDARQVLSRAQRFARCDFLEGELADGDWVRCSSVCDVAPLACDKRGERRPREEDEDAFSDSQERRPMGEGEDALPDRRFMVDVWLGTTRV